MTGTYGKKDSFEDARVTVTEFLDDFYDDNPGNYNQAFLNLERRLQEYFGYEHRDTENGVGDSESGNTEFVVYHDGLEWGRCSDENAAKAMVDSYTGEHSVWYEREPAEGPGGDLGFRKAKAHYMAAIRCLCPNIRKDKLIEAEDEFELFRNDIKNALV